MSLSHTVAIMLIRIICDTRRTRCLAGLSSIVEIKNTKLLLETIGNLFLTLSIIGGIMVFVIANSNYLPEEEDENKEE